MESSPDSQAPGPEAGLSAAAAGSTKLRLRRTLDVEAAPFLAKIDVQHFERPALCISVEATPDRVVDSFFEPRIPKASGALRRTSSTEGHDSLAVHDQNTSEMPVDLGPDDTIDTGSEGGTASLESTLFASLPDEKAASSKLRDLLLKAVFPVSELTPHSYAGHFTSLLKSEEFRSRLEVPHYDLHSVLLSAVQRAGRRYFPAPSSFKLGSQSPPAFAQATVGEAWRRWGGSAVVRISSVAALAKMPPGSSMFVPFDSLSVSLAARNAPSSAIAASSAVAPRTEAFAVDVAAGPHDSKNSALLQVPLPPIFPDDWLFVEMEVPGAAENSPALNYGSIVRLRPSPDYASSSFPSSSPSEAGPQLLSAPANNPFPLLGKGGVEIVGRVVWVRGKTVLVRVPGWIRATHCPHCVEEALWHRDIAEKVNLQATDSKGAKLAPQPAIRPADIVYLPCGHQVSCRKHHEAQTSVFKELVVTCVQQVRPGKPGPYGITPLTAPTPQDHAAVREALGKLASAQPGTAGWLCQPPLAAGSPPVVLTAVSTALERAFSQQFVSEITEKVFRGLADLQRSALLLQLRMRLCYLQNISVYAVQREADYRVQLRLCCPPLPPELLSEANTRAMMASQQAALHKQYNQQQAATTAKNTVNPPSAPLPQLPPLDPVTTLTVANSKNPHLVLALAGALPPPFFPMPVSTPWPALPAVAPTARPYNPVTDLLFGQKVEAVPDDVLVQCLLLMPPATQDYLQRATLPVTMAPGSGFSPTFVSFWDILNGLPSSHPIPQATWNSGDPARSVDADIDDQKRLLLNAFPTLFGPMSGRRAVAGASLYEEELRRWIGAAPAGADGDMDAIASMPLQFYTAAGERRFLGSMLQHSPLPLALDALGLPESQRKALQECPHLWLPSLRLDNLDTRDLLLKGLANRFCNPFAPGTDAFSQRVLPYSFATPNLPLIPDVPVLNPLLLQVASSLCTTPSPFMMAVQHHCASALEGRWPKTTGNPQVLTERWGVAALLDVVLSRSPQPASPAFEGRKAAGDAVRQLLSFSPAVLKAMLSVMLRCEVCCEAVDSAVYVGPDEGQGASPSPAQMHAGVIASPWAGGPPPSDITIVKSESKHAAPAGSSGLQAVPCLGGSSFVNARRQPNTSRHALGDAQDALSSSPPFLTIGGFRYFVSMKLNSQLAALKTALSRSQEDLLCLLRGTSDRDAVQAMLSQSKLLPGSFIDRSEAASPSHFAKRWNVRFQFSFGPLRQLLRAVGQVGTGILVGPAPRPQLVAAPATATSLPVSLIATSFVSLRKLVIQHCLLLRVARRSHRSHERSAMLSTVAGLHVLDHTGFMSALQRLSHAFAGKDATAAFVSEVMEPVGQLGPIGVNIQQAQAAVSALCSALALLPDGQAIALSLPALSVVERLVAISKTLAAFWREAFSSEASESGIGAEGRGTEGAVRSLALYAEALGLSLAAFHRLLSGANGSDIEQARRLFASQPLLRHLFPHHHARLADLNFSPVGPKLDPLEIGARKQMLNLTRDIRKTITGCRVRLGLAAPRYGLEDHSEETTGEQSSETEALPSLSSLSSLVPGAETSLLSKSSALPKHIRSRLAEQADREEERLRVSHGLAHGSVSQTPLKQQLITVKVGEKKDGRALTVLDSSTGGPQTDETLPCEEPQAATPLSSGHDSSGSVSDGTSALEKFPSFRFLDEELNSQQQEAVMAVLQSRPAVSNDSDEAEDALFVPPFCLLGPAGCGKSRCLAEMIVQLLIASAVDEEEVPGPAGSADRAHRILIVAPSDPAADLVLLAVHKVLMAPCPQFLLDSAVGERFNRKLRADPCAPATPTADTARPPSPPFTASAPATSPPVASPVAHSLSPTPSLKPAWGAAGAGGSGTLTFADIVRSKPADKATGDASGQTTSAASEKSAALNLFAEQVAEKRRAQQEAQAAASESLSLIDPDIPAAPPASASVVSSQVAQSADMPANGAGPQPSGISSTPSLAQVLGLVPFAEMDTEQGSAGGERGIFRFNLHHRKIDSLQAFDLRRYSYLSEADDVFLYPQQGPAGAIAPALARCKVIVSTALAVGSLLELVDGRSSPGDSPSLRDEFGPLALSHVIMDESSQALEPEALLPLYLCGKQTRVVLSGDPRQLGPVVRSAAAQCLGLGISLQERLLLGTSNKQLVGTAAASVERQDDRSKPEDKEARARWRNLSLHLADRVIELCSFLRPRPVGALGTSGAFTRRMLLNGADEGSGSIDPLSTSSALVRVPALSTLVKAALKRPQAETASSLSGKMEGTKESQNATKKGLGDILFSIYDDEDEDGANDGSRASRCRHATTLTVNYRSHPLLLVLPSRLFYAGTLVSQARPALTSAALRWSLLARRAENRDEAISNATSATEATLGFPLVVLGVSGPDDCHELDSPSYWNDVETRAIIYACAHLLAEAALTESQYGMWAGIAAEYQPLSPAAGAANAALPKPLSVGSASPLISVAPVDIAVITPYRQQVLLIRKNLRKVGLGAVSVGVTEHLQGGERKVVVISTVLSQRYGNKAVKTANQPMLFSLPSAEGAPDSSAVSPLPRGIGLFGDPKPFNVSVTRPQSCLVCVGDPFVWAQDPLWRSLLQYAVDNNAYRGYTTATASLDLCPLKPSEDTSLWASPSLAVGAASSMSPVAGTNSTAARSAGEAALSSTLSSSTLEELGRRVADSLSVREVDSEGAWRLMA